MSMPAARDGGAELCRVELSPSISLLLRTSEVSVAGMSFWLEHEPEGLHYAISPALSGG